MANAVGDMWTPTISHLTGPRSMGFLTRTAPRRADGTRKRLLPFREPSFVPSQAGHTYSISFINTVVIN